MQRVEGMAEESWGEDTIYCEAVCAPEDVLYEGSDDEDYDCPTSRRQRYEAAGQRFLDGQMPFLMTATLKGPFDAASGWVNPWRSKRRTGTRQSPQKAPNTSKRKRNVSIAETQFPQHDSLECHLPSPESLKHAPVDENHPFLEGDELDMVQKWRRSVQPPAKEEFWAVPPRGSRSKRKRKAVGSEWLKKLASKRRRTEVMESGPVDSPLKQSAPPQRGANTSFRIAPDLPSSAVTVRTLRRHKSDSPQVKDADGDDTLADSLKISFTSAPSRLQSPKHPSPKDLKLAIHDEAKSSEEELSAMKAAATLSSPVSQRREPQSVQKSPHGLYQQILENPSDQASQKPSSENVEAVNENFCTQQDGSFLFKMRPKLSKPDHVDKSDNVETESWSGLSGPDNEESGVVTSDNEMSEPANLLKSIQTDTPVAKNDSMEVDEDLPSSELSSLASDDVQVPGFVDECHDEMAIASHASTASDASNQSSINADDSEEAPEDPVETQVEEYDSISVVECSDIEDATDPQIAHDTTESGLNDGSGEAQVVVEHDAIPAEDASETNAAIDVNMGCDTTMGCDSITVTEENEVFHAKLRSDEGLDTSTTEQPIRREEPANNDSVSESATGSEMKEPKQSSPPNPIVPNATDSDSASESETESENGDDTGIAPSQASEPKTVESVPNSHPSLPDHPSFSLLKSSVKRLVPKSSWTKLSHMPRQINSSPPRPASIPKGFARLLHEAPQSSAPANLFGKQQNVGASQIEQVQETPRSSSIIQSSPSNMQAPARQSPSVNAIGASQQPGSPSQHISASQQSPWASSKLSQYASRALDVMPLEAMVGTPQKDDSPAIVVAQTPWPNEPIKLPMAPPDIVRVPVKAPTQLSASRVNRGWPSGQSQSVMPASTRTPAARPSTPEPQFSVKSFASFMSPSPERCPRTNKGPAWRDSGSRLPSTQGIIASATENPWDGGVSQRRVRWAPLPHELSSPASSTPHTSTERPVSPPPTMSLAELPTSRDDKFHHHFKAVARRSESSRNQRARILPTASQRSLASPAPLAMAETFLAADHRRQPSSSDETSPDVRPGHVVRLPDSQEPIDIVEDVMREMGDLLGTWDVDTELEQARKGGGIQMSQLTQGPW
ncbi:hypothetical protein B0T10DRAFT_474648 [Thelonectria olida]|uniref:Protamine P1 n=1 Tax=Thelonectria olida TaxID=1576542 RepID=A0A9P8WE20_9HYPO|nr:hypothetical protein B0T10DRAFT_474648 [Thelonectria olida]